MNGLIGQPVAFWSISTVTFTGVSSAASEPAIRTVARARSFLIQSHTNRRSDAERFLKVFHRCDAAYDTLMNSTEWTARSVRSLRRKGLDPVLNLAPGLTASYA